MGKQWEIKTMNLDGFTRVDSVDDDIIKCVSTRKGAKRECEQELFDALVPIIKRYKGRWSKDEYLGFLTGTMSFVAKQIILE